MAGESRGYSQISGSQGSSRSPTQTWPPPTASHFGKNPVSIGGDYLFRLRIDSLDGSVAVVGDPDGACAGRHAERRTPDVDDRAALPGHAVEPPELPLVDRRRPDRAEPDRRATRPRPRRDRHGATGERVDPEQCLRGTENDPGRAVSVHGLDRNLVDVEVVAPLELAVSGART